jgi:predicted SnoaL-like aldol condensation-catalyzing enzyme
MTCLGVDTSKTRSVTLNICVDDIVTMDVNAIVHEPGQEAVSELRKYRLTKEEIVEEGDEG